MNILCSHFFKFHCSLSLVCDYQCVPCKLQTPAGNQCSHREVFSIAASLQQPANLLQPVTVFPDRLRYSDRGLHPDYRSTPASQVNVAVSCGNPVKLPTILFAGPGPSAQCLLCGPLMRSFQSLTADFRGDRVQPEPAASSMTCTLLEMFCSTVLAAHNGTPCALHKQMHVFTLLFPHVGRYSSSSVQEGPWMLLCSVSQHSHVAHGL